MVLDSSDARDYQLVARALKVNQPVDMNLFVIKAIEFVNVTQPKNGTEMRITFRRKIMSEMISSNNISLDEIFSETVFIS